MHPTPEPHGIGQVARELNQFVKFAAALFVDPDLAGGAATIPLPPGRIAGIAPDHQALVAPACSLGGPQDELLRLVAFQIDGIQPDVARDRPADVTGEDDPVLVPAHDGGVAPQEGQPPGRPARGGHHIDLRVALLTPYEGQPLAIGREEGMRDGAKVGCQTPGHAPRDGHLPKIVLGHKDHPVFMDRRKSVVAFYLCGHSPSSCLHRLGCGPGLCTDTASIRVPVQPCRCPRLGHCEYAAVSRS